MSDYPTFSLRRFFAYIVVVTLLVGQVHILAELGALEKVEPLYSIAIPSLLIYMLYPQFKWMLAQGINRLDERYGDTI